MLTTVATYLEGAWNVALQNHIPTQEEMSRADIAVVVPPHGTEKPVVWINNTDIARQALTGLSYIPKTVIPITPPFVDRTLIMDPAVFGGVVFKTYLSIIEEGTLKENLSQQQVEEGILKSEATPLVSVQVGERTTHFPVVEMALSTLGNQLWEMHLTDYNAYLEMFPTDAGHIFGFRLKAGLTFLYKQDRLEPIMLPVVPVLTVRKPHKAGVV